MPHSTDRIYFRETTETWHVAVPCPIEGDVDETVEWAEAKTPRTAAGIAELRHEECHAEAGRKATAESRKAQIAAAVEEVARLEALVPVAEQEFEVRLKEADEANERANDIGVKRAKDGTPVGPLTPADHAARIATGMMLQAEDRLESYREGVKQAKKRLTETRKQNTTKQ